MKVLHVDKNDYYGGIDAGLSLDEAQRWVQRREDATVFKTDDADSGLGPSRTYTISLRPQIIYAKSRFLPTLVSSQIHTQLEFQAVGSFWIHTNGNLRKIPSNREDVFADDTIPVRDKRRLMGLLRYVIEEPDADEGVDTSDMPSTLEEKLTTDFRIPHNLMPPVQALTLSTDILRNTSFDTAVARFKRHLMSMGYFGPGLAAVMAKYGGNSEIAQVACRAGAVGGFVYLLGHSVQTVHLPTDDSLVGVELSDGTRVKSKHVVGMRDDLPSAIVSTVDTSQGSRPTQKVAHRISIISKSLRHLFTSASENSTVPAVVIILVDNGHNNMPPVYLQVHSEDTGECPQGQCIVYASTLHQGTHFQARLEAAIQQVIKTTNDPEQPKVLWTLAYTLDEAAHPTPGHNYTSDDSSKRVVVLPERIHDLAFDDTIR